MSRKTRSLIVAGVALSIMHTGLASAASDQDAALYRLQLAAPETYRMQLPGSIVTALPHDTAAKEAAIRENLDVRLLHAVMAIESGHNSNAVSPTGAVGLMQLMPGTARRFGVANLQSPRENLNGGAAYLRVLLNRFDQNLELALAAYNAGEAAVEAHGRQIPPYAETRRYVPAVTKRYRELIKQDNPYRLNPAALPMVRKDHR